MKKNLYLLTVLTICWITLAAKGQQYLHGPLSGSLSPAEYIVNGDCQVFLGDTLTIQPGVTLKFSGHYYFQVYGRLFALGSEQDSIKFIRLNPDETCKHGGLRFNPGSAGILQYCLIDYAKNQTYPNYYGGGVYSNGASVAISHCTISNCYATSGGGVYATGGTGISIDNSIFYNNTAGNGGGLHLYNSPNSYVTHSLFAKNGSTST